MACFPVHFALLLILGCATINSSAIAASLSIEDKLKELESRLEMKIILLEAKNVKLVEKVTQLEIQLEHNNELREDLTLKMAQLNAKNVQLETKVQEQEKILTFLLQATELPTLAGGSKSFPNNRPTAIQSAGKMNGIPRTCRELRASDPSLPSGMQWIDPDGQGVGDDAIYVYCDMTSGSTSILHDSESPIDVDHCADPGCYSRSINYNASIKQLKSLIDLSAECHQSIKYDCNYAPFEFDKVPYAWWNDREGNVQYFWSGNNTDGIHTCQCGIDGNCVDSVVKCNCDTGAPVQLVDDGVITDKHFLPVTRLNFGRTVLETSSGIHTLGRFECTGTVALTGLPTSCEDLWLIGHTLNGFYSVMGSTMMESVYCDFTQLPGDAGFQKWIGYVDVKSAPVHFYVQRNSSFNSTFTPIPFDYAHVNEGNAMDLTSGIFTAPRPGIYFFSFTGMAEFPASVPTVHLAIILYLNGVSIVRGLTEEANTINNQKSPLTVQSTLNLKSGDQVSVQNIGMSPGAFLFDNSWHMTHFSGFMLEEIIVSSL